MQPIEQADRPDPLAFWQDLLPPGPEGLTAGGAGWFAALPDGRRLLLPTRVLPGNGDRGVASLIVNQASFPVLDALADAVAAGLAPHDPEVVIGVPTLGLPLAEAVARRLGHTRMVALSISRKFWYDDTLSRPLRSITSPGGGTAAQKSIWIDPRTLPLVQGRRVALIDDVLSSGASLTAVLALLADAGIAPAVIGAAMVQGEGWRTAAGDRPVVHAIATPILSRDPATGAFAGA